MDESKKLEILPVSEEHGEMVPEGGWLFVVTRIVPVVNNYESVVLTSWCPDEETARKAIKLMKKENGGKFKPQFERKDGKLIPDEHRLYLDFGPDKNRVEGYAEIFPNDQCHVCLSWGHDRRAMYGEREIKVGQNTDPEDRTLVKCERCKRKERRETAEDAFRKMRARCGYSGGPRVISQCEEPECPHLDDFGDELTIN